MISDHLIRDPLFRPLLKETPGMRVPGAWDAFETSVRAVLGQQVSVAGASTIAGRLVDKFGTPANVNHPSLRAHFPAPAALAESSIQKIAALGMPASRAETIRSLARFAKDGGLNRAPGDTMASRVQSMTELKGIGDWTAQYVAMRVFRDPDAFPAGDLGLRKAAKTDARSLMHQSQSWRPWRAYAAMYLWESLK
jgi:AraC family transcriptional regulator of adaptative response / DNA-3-methyladenine glycosylase II